MKISHNSKDILFEFNNASVMIRNVKSKMKNVTPKQNQLEEIMRPNDRVITPVGPGRIVSREADAGILRDRYCVELDDSESLDGMSKQTHDKYGGVFFHKSEIKKEEIANEMKSKDA